jgi:hypothetical protein
MVAREANSDDRMWPFLGLMGSSRPDQFPPLSGSDWSYQLSSQPLPDLSHVSVYPSFSKASLFEAV